MFSSIRARKYINYMSSCIDSVKSSIQDYRAYACGYDERQTRYYATHSQYDPHHVTSVTQSMEKLIKAPVQRSKRIKTMATDLAENVVHTFIYGAFVVSHLIWFEKKTVEDYFLQMANEKQANNNDVNNLSSTTFVKSTTAGTIASGIADAMNDNMKLDNDDGVWTKDVNDAVFVQKGTIQPNPSKRTFDDAWGFVTPDLNVVYKVSFFFLFT